MQIKKRFELILCVLAFAGCSTFDQTILVPEQNGIYHAIALDSSDFGAQRSALNRANKTCSGRENMRYVVDSQQTFYRGTATNAGPMSAASSGNSAARETVPDKKTAEDYKSVVTFHCVAY